VKAADGKDGGSDQHQSAAAGGDGPDPMCGSWHAASLGRRAGRREL
jgi:hypothetical protein